MRRSVQQKCRYKPEDDTMHRLQEHTPLDGQPAGHGRTLSSADDVFGTLQLEAGYQGSYEGPGFLAGDLDVSTLRSMLILDTDVLKSSTFGRPEDRSSGIDVDFTLIEAKIRDITAQMPLDIIVCELVDVYFEEANWYFGVLELMYFKKSFSQWQLAKNSFQARQSVTRTNLGRFHFAAVLFQVMALALHYLPHTASSVGLLQLSSTTVRDALSARYSHNGTQIMFAVGSVHPTLDSIQHDELRALWFKNAGQGRDSWFAIGSGIR